MATRKRQAQLSIFEEELPKETKKKARSAPTNIPESAAKGRKAVASPKSGPQAEKPAARPKAESKLKATAQEQKAESKSSAPAASKKAEAKPKAKSATTASSATKTSSPTTRKASEKKPVVVKEAAVKPKKAAVKSKAAQATVEEPPLPHPFRGYRFVREEGCEAEVRSATGRFFPYDADTVAFFCSDMDVARQIRRKWSGQVRVFAQGDEETTLLLPKRLYPEVASLIGVTRRAA